MKNRKIIGRFVAVNYYPLCGEKVPFKAVVVKIKKKVLVWWIGSSMISGVPKYTIENNSQLGPFVLENMI